jgi:hypothetical protein
MIKKTWLETMFKRYWSDYLTIKEYASVYNISEAKMYRIINIGRKIYNKNCDKIKRG